MNEKVVYSKTREGPVIKSVIRAASEEAQEKPKRKPRRESKPQTVRSQRVAKENENEKSKDKEREKGKDKGKGKEEEEQEDGEESGQDRTLEVDNHDSMDVDENQAETSTGFREDPKITADIIVFGSDDVVSQGKTHGPLLLCFVLMGLSHGTHGTSRLILFILFFIFCFANDLRVRVIDIAESDSSIQFRNVQSGEYQLHRGLEDPGYVVTGTMRIKPNGRKPVNSGTNTSMVRSGRVYL